MLGTFGKDLVAAIDALINTQIESDEWKYEQDGYTEKKEAAVPEDIRLRIPRRWAGLNRICMDLSLPRSIVTLQRLLEDADRQPLPVDDYEYHLKQLDRDVRYDLERVYFHWVPSERKEFYEAGFGVQAVAAAFSDAIPEMKEAGTCYALGRATASVFDLMRAVEWALRTLVVAVGAPPQKVPLDYEEWNKLIDLVDAQCKTAVDQWGKSAEQVNARQFFKRIVADLHAFKDDVRNIVMHTRDAYDMPGALSVRNRVDAWFSVLATKANENMKPGELLNRSLFS